MAVGKAYHYTKESTWKKLFSDQNNDLEPQRPVLGLWALVGLTESFPGWATRDKFIFAFPDNLGNVAWSSDARTMAEFDVLARDIGREIAILEFDLLPTDEAYVIDRSHVSDYQFGLSGDKRGALTRYIESRVSAQSYNGNFRMPELIIKNPIELRRIRFHSRYVGKILI